MSQTREESYYKLLGTTAKISQRRIKEKYIEAVKKHPPEQDPDRFEKIREAYDTLKDPLRRKQYDLSRKYGGKLEKLLNKASASLNLGEYREAGKHYEDVLYIDPDNLSAQFGLMTVSVLNWNPTEGEKYFRKVLSNPRGVEEQIDPSFVYSNYASVLAHEDYIEEAYDLLEEGIETYPESLSSLCTPLTAVCLMWGDAQRAIEVAEMAIPEEKEETIDHLEAFVSWITVVANLEQWSNLSKVQSRFRKFLKNLHDEDDREEAYIVLMENYEALLDRENYRLAEIFLDFAKPLADDEDDKKELSEMLKETKKLARLNKELKRLSRDDSMFPLIFYYTIQWFYEDEFHPAVQDLEETFPKMIVQELEEEEDWFAAGILSLKKKYPAIYNYFRSKWDELFEDLTKHFNRERKRELKKMKA